MQHCTWIENIIFINHYIYQKLNKIILKWRNEPLRNITDYSQANHIAELRALRTDTLREMQQLYTYDTYVNNDYFD